MIFLLERLPCAMLVSGRVISEKSHHPMYIRHGELPKSPFQLPAARHVARPLGLSSHLRRRGNKNSVENAVLKP